MSTLSVPLSPTQEEFIKNMVKSGAAANKADVVRKALKLLAEEEAVMTVLKAEEEFRQGKYFTGDLEKIIRKFPG
ncbi:MAG: type II toxin-antitoxin system ParD family antitoxin [Patescibacteria group bacterium]